MTKMRVLVAGASGAIGTRLVAQLVERGHEVVGTYRSAGHAERVRAAGGKPVALDLLDAAAVRQAVAEARPDAVVHQATALAKVTLSRHMHRMVGPTNQLRTRGTDNLLDAARENGVRNIVAQSNASLYARVGGRVKTEEDPLDPEPPAKMREAAAAGRHLDETVRKAGGIALRYGAFYGANDALVDAVRKRRFPIIGQGDGIFNFIHLDDAAAATVLALERGRPGAYNVVDDEPAPFREWLPVMAQALGAKPPRRIPLWLARLVGGHTVNVMTEFRGASNAKAKRELGWTLRYPSWRHGFAAAYANIRGPRVSP